MLSPNVRVFVATRPVDMRGSFDRLGGLVRDQLGEDPRSGSLFVFTNKAGNRLKILFFDQTGECVLYKRLDRGTFHGIIRLDPENVRAEVDADALRRLLAGEIREKRTRMH